MRPVREDALHVENANQGMLNNRKLQWKTQWRPGPVPEQVVDVPGISGVSGPRYCKFHVGLGCGVCSLVAIDVQQPHNVESLPERIVYACRTEKASIHEDLRSVCHSM